MITWFEVNEVCLSFTRDSKMHDMNNIAYVMLTLREPVMY